MWQTVGMAASGFILTDCFTLRGPCPRSSPRRDHRCHKTARLPSGNAIRLAGGLHLPSGNARLGNPDRQAPTSHNRAIIQRRGWRNPRSTFGEMLPLPSVAGAAHRPLRGPAGRPPWLSQDATCVKDRLVALRTVPVLIAGRRQTSPVDRRLHPTRVRPQAAYRRSGLLRVSLRAMFGARCASGQPSPVPRSRLRQAPPSPRCPAWPALSRNRGTRQHRAGCAVP